MGPLRAEHRKVGERDARRSVVGGSGGTRGSLGRDEVRGGLWPFYLRSPSGSREKQRGTELLGKLADLAERGDLPVGERIEAAAALSGAALPGSAEQERGGKALADLSERGNLTVGERIEAAAALYGSSPPGSAEKERGAKAPAGFGGARESPCRGTNRSGYGSPQQQPFWVGGRRARRQDTTGSGGARGSSGGGANPSGAGSLSSAALPGSAEEQRGAKVLLDLAERGDLTVGERIEAAAPLLRQHLPWVGQKKSEAPRYCWIWRSAGISRRGSESKRRRLSSIGQQPFLGRRKKSEAPKILLDLAERGDLTAGERLLVAHYLVVFGNLISGAHPQGVLRALAGLARDEDLPTEIRDDLYATLQAALPTLDKVTSVKEDGGE